MLTATKIFTFDAAHYLPLHPGLCKNMHGHRWTLEVTVRRPKECRITDMTPADMILDFTELKRIVNSAVINKFDHACINDISSWPTGLRPTAENMINVIREKLEYEGLNGWLVGLKLWETPTSYVTWAKE